MALLQELCPHNQNVFSRLFCSRNKRSGVYSSVSIIKSKQLFLYCCWFMAHELLIRSYISSASCIAFTRRMWITCLGAQLQIKMALAWEGCLPYWEVQCLSVLTISSHSCLLFLNLLFTRPVPQGVPSISREEYLVLLHAATPWRRVMS